MIPGASFYGKLKDDYEYDKKHPNTIITFSNGNGWSKKKAIHPTQKPVELFEYLIKTYTNENDLVLDNCAGSGTTGIACLNTKRQFILMEQDPNYFEKIKKRVADFNKRPIQNALSFETEQ